MKICCKQYEFTVIDPMTKATTSVNEVIVIDDPAICSIRPIRSGKVDRSCGDGCSRCTFCQLAIITNMSSMPNPISKNGSDVWTGPYEIPKYEHNPIADANDMPMHNKPMPHSNSFRNIQKH